jgi:hypothetical protein
MNSPRWIAILVFTAFAAFAIGWHIEYRRITSRASRVPAYLTGEKHSTQAPSDCGTNASDDHWDTVRIVDYQPVQTLYMVEWQHCAGDIEGRRVRITDADFQKVFYQYADDEILRVEKVELLGDHVPQLLIVTGSSSTNDRFDWHVLSEVSGQLHEWTWPDYNAMAEKLLGVDEDFCCKEWNFHLRGHDIVLARGISARTRTRIAALAVAVCSLRSSQPKTDSNSLGSSVSLGQNTTAGGHSRSARSALWLVRSQDMPAASIL